jgi:hypothetical protein
VGIGLHLLEPDLSEEDFFIAGLETQLADVIDPAVSRRVDLLLLLLVDASDVT